MHETNEACCLLEGICLHHCAKDIFVLRPLDVLCAVAKKDYLWCCHQKQAIICKTSSVSSGHGLSSRFQSGPCVCLHLCFLYRVC